MWEVADSVGAVVRKHPLAECESCSLYESGTYVPSTFPDPDVSCSDGERLAFIGEAPGENEVKQGEVFVGLSGKVLDGTLQHLGIDRRAALMTNASACHYDKEQFDKLPPDAVECCRPRLLHELRTAGVNTAVTLGAHAVRAMTGTREGITSARPGGPRPAELAPEILIVPTFHPAYAMRDHNVFPLIVGDIAKVYDGVWDTWEDVPYRVIRSETEANHEIMRLWRQPVMPLEVDTESGADKDDVFGGAIKDVLCIGIWDEDRSAALVFPRDVLNESNRRMMGRLFVRNGLSGQNLKYDICRVLNVFLGVDGEPLRIRIKGDRMLQSYALNPVKGVHGLGYMGREYLGAPEWKHWIKDSMEEGRRRAKAEARARKEKIAGRFSGLDYSLVDPKVLYRYNAYDVGVTRRLRDHFDLLIDEVDGLPELYDRLISYSQMLVDVEQRGMEIDLDRNADLETEYRGLLDELDLGEINPNSPQQIRRFLDTVGLHVEDTRKDTIQQLVSRYELTGEREDVVSFCKTLLEHRGASKVMSTYVLGLRNTLIDGVAHPDYSLLSLTGRPKARNPNSQNTPKGSKLRSQYVARHGRLYVHADYGQAELRTMAWLAEDETLRRMFMSPGDIFYDMCCSVYRGYEGFDPERQSKCRQLVKTIAYGTAYGRGPTAIASAFGISLVEAKKIQALFNAKIPDVVRYQNEIKRRAVSGEDLVTVFGRRRRFKLVTDQNIVDVQNEAMAHMPQSTASDICMTAAVELNRQGLPIVNLIHDAIIAEVDVGDTEEAQHLMRKVMITTAEDVTEGYVPWKVDVETGKSYGDFK